MPVNGSLKIPIFGVMKVNSINISAIIQIAAKERYGFLHMKVLLNSFVSYIYDAAAEIKKIAMLSQSGDLPTAPL